MNRPIDPDLDDVPNVKAMSREQLDRNLVTMSRQFCEAQTEVRSLKRRIDIIERENESLISENDKTWSARSQISSQMMAIKSENEPLRAIFPKIMDAIGIKEDWAEDSSLEFLEEIPSSVYMVVRSLKAHIDGYRAKCQNKN